MSKVFSRLTIKCPKCGSLTNYDTSNKSRPFCSERCKNNDIVAWAEESYGIPGPSVEDNLNSPRWAEDLLDDEI